MICKKKCYLLPMVLLYFNLSYGQSRQPALKRATKAIIIERLCNVLNSNYIFPDTAARMTRHIRSKLQTGAYKRITDPVDFARYLTTDLWAIYGDKHLNMLYEPDLKDDAQPISYVQQAAQKMKMAEQARQQNYGFSKVEIMSGNIGYIALNGFLT